MLRILSIFVVAIAVVALITRRKSVFRVFQVILGLMVLYTVLKLTGAIEAIAPDRNGVF